MRISDWSSDVCSSDLCRGDQRHAHVAHARDAYQHHAYGHQKDEEHPDPVEEADPSPAAPREEIVGSGDVGPGLHDRVGSAQACRSEEHTSELQSLMRISYAGLGLKKTTRQENE